MWTCIIHRCIKRACIMHTCMMKLMHHAYLQHAYICHGYMHYGCMHHGYVHPGYMHPGYIIHASSIHASWIHASWIHTSWIHRGYIIPVGANYIYADYWWVLLTVTWHEYIVKYAIASHTKLAKWEMENFLKVLQSCSETWSTLPPSPSPSPSNNLAESTLPPGHQIVRSSSI